jgi:hypothetical protein
MTEQELSKAIVPSTNRVMPSTKALTKNKFPKGGIGPQFVNKHMHWFETFWHTHKRYPTDADIITEFGFTVEQVLVLNNSKFWLQSLDRRGIRRPLQEHEKPQLTDKQVAAIALITNYSDRRPIQARLNAMGVTEEMLHGWQKDPVFRDALTLQAEDVFANVAPVAQVRLAQQIDKGNLNAIKFYFEITGKAETPETINVKKTLQTIIEAVQKYCTPDQLNAIQEEVNAVLQIKGVA